MPTSVPLPLCALVWGCPAPTRDAEPRRTSRVPCGCPRTAPWVAAGSAASRGAQRTMRAPGPLCWHELANTGCPGHPIAPAASPSGCPTPFFTTSRLGFQCASASCIRKHHPGKRAPAPGSGTAAGSVRREPPAADAVVPDGSVTDPPCPAPHAMGKLFQTLPPSPFPLLILAVGWISSSFGSGTASGSVLRPDRGIYSPQHNPQRGLCWY